ncbi:tetraacyldisaccharide 4'-kinase [Dokdonella sp.]|uniref:tetraacyldisaccharide 4'-kinase n=1 Tax=Dokdonella sp. TaxID=2291710 RepID=UPI0027B89232|nr:tetraacyldisaccharide 4'-kinase [Dokdonella sp.]
MDLAQRLNRIWYESAAVPWWLAALVPVYRALAALRQLPYALGLRRPARIGVPVVVVGNLVVGGSGKTPLVIALVAALRERGWRPGVVSRGYGGSARVAMRVDDATSPTLAGDEPCLIRRRCGVPVAVGRNRAEAARLVLEQGADVVIADDGLQHPALARDIEICVIDGRRRFGNGRLLPAGPLREPLTRLYEVDFRVCNGSQAHAGEIGMQLVGSQAVPLAGTAPPRPVTDFAGQRVHGVAAIGDPARFFASLRAAGLEVCEHAFADHHAFAAADLDFGDNLPVLMTEKDAVKCAAFARAGHWYVPITALLPAALADAVSTRLGGGKAA